MDAILTEGFRPEICARCGAHFDCGVASGSCWCARLPVLEPLPDDLPARCLCERCLRTAAGAGRDGEADGDALPNDVSPAP